MRLDFSVQVNPPPGSALLNHEAVRRFGVYFVPSEPAPGNAVTGDGFRSKQHLRLREPIRNCWGFSVGPR